MSCGKPCQCASFREHLLTISMQSSTHPVELTERQWHRDMAAYKRLRKNGLQPKGIDGCADLETRATTQQEIEMGHIFPTQQQRNEAREGQELAQEIFGG